MYLPPVKITDNPSVVFNSTFFDLIANADADCPEDVEFERGGFADDGTAYAIDADGQWWKWTLTKNVALEILERRPSYALDWAIECVRENPNGHIEDIIDGMDNAMDIEREESAERRRFQAGRS